MSLACVAVAVSCKKIEEPDDIQLPVDYRGIKTYTDLKAFAASVNAGKPLDSFCNDAGEVVLLSDVDMSEGKGSEWIPIGRPATIKNDGKACTYTGPAFKGVFNGQGHAIRNFTTDVTVADKQTWGLFGVLDGATVKNLVLGAESDDNSLVTISATGAADCGILAGTAKGKTTIQGCTNHIPLKILGNQSDARMAAGIFVGMACSTDAPVNLTELKNCGDIEVAAGKNTGNNESCVMVGGIAGFCTGNSTGVTMLETCENTGDITGACGRSSGIAATMNAKSTMRYCINRGDVKNSFANARVGNITCVMGAGCSIEDCSNYGDCVTSDSQTTTGGMVALLDADDVAVVGGGNYGKVIGANEQYHGLLVANFNKFSMVNNVFAGGSCGTYSSDGQHRMHELTKDNWRQHIGYCSSANLSKIVNLSSSWGESGGSTDVLPDMKAASLRILFIGNSFTQDAVTHLPGICKAAGATDITMAHLYYGGRIISQYYDDRMVANNTLYYANPGASGFTTFGTKASIDAVARSGRWDVITIQEHTGSYCSWIWNDSEKTAIENLISYVVGTQSVKPKVLYIMSQAYHDNAKIGSGSMPYVTWTDHKGMYKVIVAQAKKVLEETSVDDVIATGTMLENLRTSSINNEKDLSRDGYHMDYGIARYGASCTVFEKIVQPATGKTLEGNTFRYTGSDSSTTTNVTDANAPIAQLAAHNAVLKPFEVTSMGEGGEDEGDDDQGCTLNGKGTSAEPWQISKGEDMLQISATLEVGTTKYFEMTSDIDMSSITDWSPINLAIQDKRIDFDGKNHKITGFTCTNKTYTSLFGLVCGSVRNLVIVMPEVSNTGQLGVLATWLGQNDGSFPVEISNVHIKNAVVNMTGNSSTKSSMGILAANCGGATISDCSVSGTLSYGTGVGASFNCVGGLVGRTYSQKSKISRCSFDGVLNINGGQLVGGIVGGMSSGVATTIEDCYTQGTINANTAGYVGGIVGDISQGSVVKNCYSTADITGSFSLGGIVGRASNNRNPNTDANVHFDSQLNMSVIGCIAWNRSITSTNKAAETPASHYSSAAVVGFTIFKNTLSNCCRRPDMCFDVYMDSVAQYNTLNDTPDCSPDNPYVKESGSPTYYCPYNGKAAASGATVSSTARTLGWDTAVWKLDDDLPVLK